MRAARVGDDPLAERLLPLAIGLGMYVQLRGYRSSAGRTLIETSVCSASAGAGRRWTWSRANRNWSPRG